MTTRAGVTEPPTTPRARRRALDTAWLAALVILGSMAGLSWLLDWRGVDATGTLRMMFLCATGALAVEMVFERLLRRRGSRHVLALAHAQRFVWLGVAWHASGGIDDPIGLMAFVPPLIVSGHVMLPRLPLIASGTALATISAIALAESAELRWLLFQLGLPVQWLISLLSGVNLDRVESAVVSESPVRQLIVLGVFGTLTVVIAAVSARLTALSITIRDRLQVLRDTSAENGDVFRSALIEHPVPTALVYPDDGQIVACSRSFRTNMLLPAADQGPVTLFSCLSFADPTRIRRLLAEPSGEIPFEPYWIGTEARMARVQAYQVTSGDAVQTVISIHDVHQMYYLMAAADAVADPLFVISANREIVYFNAAAGRLCPHAHFGMDSSRVPPTARTGWWDAGETEQHSLTIQGRVFSIDAMPLRPPHGDLPLTVVRLRTAKVTADRVDRDEARAS